MEKKQVEVQDENQNMDFAQSPSQNRDPSLTTNAQKENPFECSQIYQKLFMKNRQSIKVTRGEQHETQNGVGMFSYTYSSHNREQEKSKVDQLNLFSSCMEKFNLEKSDSRFDAESLEVQSEVTVLNLVDEIDQIISDFVQTPIQDVQKFIHRSEGPYMPLTLTLWRQLAYKKFKTHMFNTMQQSTFTNQNIRVDEITSQFCQRIDQEILDQQFYYILVSQYHEKIQKHQLNPQSQTKLLPQELVENMDIIKESKEYSRLIQCIAEWFTLMELSEDIIERIQLYGISQYLDEQAALDKIHRNWCVNLNEDKSYDQRLVQANGYFTGALTYFMNSVSDVMYKVGLFGVIQASLSRWALGFAAIHPGQFVTILVSSVLIKMGSNQMSKGHLLQHIDQITKHFAIVTSNLMTQYLTASEIVSRSFVERDTKKVHDAINKLIEGNNKMNEGTLQRFFDERDFMADQFHVDEHGHQEWINISKYEKM